MEELREIAISYYKEGSSEVQAKAKSFFHSMDFDGDGRVDLEEFLTFMKHQGYPHMRKDSFFRLLNRRSNGTLSFTDVMTLYYIIKSGRPFCDCCGEFIPAVFFSCVACYNASPRASYTICHPCHKARKSKHAHPGRRAFFLDNFTFMQAITTTPNGTITITSTIGSAKQSIPSSVSALTSTKRSATRSLTSMIDSAQLQSIPSSVSASTSTQRSATRSLTSMIGSAQLQSIPSSVSASTSTQRSAARRSLTSMIDSAKLQSIPSSISASTLTQRSATRSLTSKTVITTPISSAKSRSSPPVSASTSTQDFATSFMHDSLNQKLVESGHPPIPTPSTAVVSRSRARPSTHVTKSNSDAHSAAIVPTAPRQKGINEMKVAELAFKALEGALVIGNLCTNFGCTIL